MWSYFVRYFLARSAYDALRAPRRHRRRHLSRQQQADLAEAERIMTTPAFEQECHQMGLDPDLVRRLLRGA